MHGLRLAEHRRGVDGVAPRSRKQRGRAQQDRRSLLIGRRRPHLPGLERGLDGVAEVLARTDGVLRDGQLLAMRRADLATRCTPTPLAADLHRDLGTGIGELRQPGLEALSIGVAGSVGAYGLVDWGGNLEMSVGSHMSS